MENKKIIVTSTSRSRVGINIPELHFKRVWEKRNSKIAIDFSTLQEMIYDPGVHYLFEQGILYIDDMDAKIELGLEDEGTKEPTKVIKLEEAQLKRALGPMILADFKKFFSGLTEEQKFQVAEYAIEHELSDFSKQEVIKEGTGIYVLSAIQLNRADKEETN